MNASTKQTALVLKPNFHNPSKPHFVAYGPGDDFYEMLIDAHRELSDEQSQSFNARLLLILSNHIGNLEVLKDAIATALETANENTEN